MTLETKTWSPPFQVANQGVFTILSQGHGDSLAEVASSQRDVDNSEIAWPLVWPVLKNEILHHLRFLNRAGNIGRHPCHCGLDDLGRDRCLRFLRKEFPSS